MLNIKLFCFPYAGGSASVYSRWKIYLNENTGIELVPVELAGRGKRIDEPLYGSLQDAVNDLYHKIGAEITHAPYAFFGHSLGGVLIYELAQKIKSLTIRQPLHLFFSGKSAPNIEREGDKKFHLMDDDEFKDEVIKLGGTSQEVFEHPELAGIFLPLLRSDFKLAETDLATRAVSPLHCDISILSGKDDPKVSAEQIEAWSAHTTGSCTIHYFSGGHFFLHDEIPVITKIIDTTLKKHRSQLLPK